MMRRTLVALLFAGFVAGPAFGAVTEEQVMDVAQELACLCGSCPTRPLHECRCGYAGQQRDRIKAELEKGQNKETVIAGFVAEFGERIYVTPPKEGFNLLAWFMPFFGILVGGFAVRAVLKGWSRKREAVEAGPQASESTVPDDARAKLEAALKEREK